MPDPATVISVLWKPISLFVNYILAPVLSKLGISLLSRHTERKLPEVWRKYLFGGRERLSHLEELASTLKEMPFIYKGLDFDILHGYVDVDYAPFDLKTFKPKQTARSDAPSTERILKVELDHALKRSNKVLFIGEPGVGKTTFQRYQLLKSINNKGAFEYCGNSKQCVPFFVSLKFINNDHPFPIRDYLLKNYSYLSKEGASRLTVLAEEGKLFLFLDGYDEVPFSREAGQNFCQQELRYMISDEPQKNWRHKLAEDVAPFYAAMAKSKTSRIWLSSRIGFYQTHALRGSSSTQQIENDLFAVQLRGIGKHRAQLVSKIFDRYRNNEIINKNLNEQYFLDQLDADPKSEIHQLSYVPLFLTIMCYNYVQKVIDTKSYGVEVASGVDGLIRECIALLLIDIDEQKARKLSDVERDIQKRTRNDYLTEKENFLPFFAAQLFVDNKSVFDVQYINGKVHQFFTVFPDLPNKEKILRELDGKSASPSFTDQLINCGIFVLSEVRQNVVNYDFPHQRFKEFLASEFFAESKSNFLMDHIKEQGLGELISVFFKVSKEKEMILNRLLELTSADPPNASYYHSIFVESLKQAPEGFDASPILDQFLLRAVSENRSFQFAPELKPFFTPREEFIDSLRSTFSEAWAQSKGATLTLCCDLLNCYNKPLLRQLLTSVFDSSNEAPDKTLISRQIKLVGTYDRDLLRRIIDKLFQNINQSNLATLGLYTKVLNEHHPTLLRQSLKEIFTRAVESADWVSLTFCCDMLIDQQQQGTIDTLFAQYLERLASDNKFAALPEKFLRYFRRRDLLVKELSKDFDSMISEKKLFAAALTLELLLHSDIRQLQHSLKRYTQQPLEKIPEVIIQLLLTSSVVESHAREFSPIVMNDIDTFIDFQHQITKSGLELLRSSEGRSGHNFYVITDKTIRLIRLWFTQKGQEMDEETWNWFRDNRYQVFLSDTYLSQAPGEVEQWFVRVFTRATRVKYESYKVVAAAIEELTTAGQGHLLFFPKSDQ